MRLLYCGDSSLIQIKVLASVLESGVLYNYVECVLVSVLGKPKQKTEWDIKRTQGAKNNTTYHFRVSIQALSQPRKMKSLRTLQFHLSYGQQ